MEQNRVSQNVGFNCSKYVHPYDCITLFVDLGKGEKRGSVVSLKKLSKLKVNMKTFITVFVLTKGFQSSLYF